MYLFIYVCSYIYKQIPEEMKLNLINSRLHKEMVKFFINIKIHTRQKKNVIFLRKREGGGDK